MSDTTYRKICVTPEKFGSRDFATATSIVDVKLPSIPPGRIGVRVRATGIEASDIIQMAGGYGPLAGKKPVSAHDGTVQLGDLGCEGVGVVEHVGEGVDGSWKIGQAVMWAGFGVSFREYVVLDPAGEDFFDATKVPSAKPEWTAVPVSAMTAVGALELVGHIAKGQTVLVTAAAGGTGHIALQWAKKYGARVAGTCGSEEKEQMLKDLGCDVVVNYRTQDVEAVLAKEFPGGFDLVYEGVGGRMGNIAKRLLGKAGTLVSVGSVSSDYSGATKGDQNPDPPHQPLATQTHAGFFMPNGKNYPEWPRLVQETVDAVASGAVRIVMDEGCKEFNGLEGVYKAQARMRSGKNVGKIYATITPA